MPGGVFGIFHCAISVAALGLHADHERGLSSLSRRQDCLGAIHALFLSKSSPSAGDLRPYEAMNAAPVAEFDFSRETIEIQLIVGRARSLANGKEAPQRLSLGGEDVPGRGQGDRASADAPQEFAPSLRGTWDSQ